MCGRYASARSRIELLEEFSVQRDRVIEPLEPDYNVAPTKPVYAVLTRRGRAEAEAEAGAGSSRSLIAEDPTGPSTSDAPRSRTPRTGAESAAGAGSSRSLITEDPTGPSTSDSPRSRTPRTGAEPAAGDGVARELRVVRWGLVPWWAKDVSIASRLINARCETVSEKPAFRRAFANRRCLLPADGYYEWQPPADGTGKAKQPFYICRGDGGPLAFAGLYELWRDRAHPDGDPDAWLWSATIITTTAPDDLGRIHDRMPMVIDPGSWDDWLDPANSDVGDLRALLAPAVAGGLTSYPVSRTVNSVRNNGPELIEPVDLSMPGEGGPAPGGPASGGPASGGPASGGPASGGPERGSPERCSPELRGPASARPLEPSAVRSVGRRGGASRKVPGSGPDTLF